jgi:hypothetical protein
MVKREEKFLQKLDRFGWFPILLEMKKMFSKGKTMLFPLDKLKKIQCQYRLRWIIE